jgi:protein gp37
MGDLFHPCTPQFQIELVLAMARACPQHTLQFLTKNPKRYREFNPWPKNCWLGTTVTNQPDADERLPWLLQAEAQVRFVSHEPLLGSTDMAPWLQGEADLFGTDSSFNRRSGPGVPAQLSWAILGGMTGPGAVKPDPEWVLSLEKQYQSAGVPIFEKGNLYPGPLKYPVFIREYPHA